MAEDGLFKDMNITKDDASLTFAGCVLGKSHFVSDLNCLESLPRTFRKCSTLMFSDQLKLSLSVLLATSYLSLVTALNELKYTL